jgi:hypothetical protein
MKTSIWHAAALGMVAWASSAEAADFRQPVSEAHRRLAALHVPPSVLPKSLSHDEAVRRLLDSPRFLEPQPVRRHLFRRDNHSVRDLRSHFMNGESRHVRHLDRRGWLFPPNEPGISQQQDAAMVLRLLNVPSRGLVRMRLRVASLAPEGIAPPRLEVAISSGIHEVEVTAQEDTGHREEVCFYLQDPTPVNWRENERIPASSVVEVRICNRLSRPWTEDQRKSLGEHLRSQDGTSPLPWLLLGGIELEVGFRQEWHSPSEKTPGRPFIGPLASRGKGVNGQANICPQP